MSFPQNGVVDVIDVIFDVGNLPHCNTQKGERNKE